MLRFSIGSIFFVTAAAVSAYAADLATVIAKVSTNCDRIVTYAADAEVRYKI